MKSHEIIDYVGGGANFWLQECALQAAISNERAEKRDNDKHEAQLVVNRKTHQLHKILDKAAVPLKQGEQHVSGDPPTVGQFNMTLADRVKWLVDNFMQLDEALTTITADRDNLLDKLQEAASCKS